MWPTVLSGVRYCRWSPRSSISSSSTLESTSIAGILIPVACDVGSKSRNRSVESTGMNPSGMVGPPNGSDPAHSGSAQYFGLSKFPGYRLANLATSGAFSASGTGCSPITGVYGAAPADLPR